MINDKGKIIAIHQPDFLSYYGFFDKIFKCDEFIFLDNVQISKGGWTHRDRIKTKNNEVIWITVQLKKMSSATKINEVEVCYEHNWHFNMKNLIYENYKNSFFFNKIFDHFSFIFEKKFTKLIDLNLKIIFSIFEILDIKKKFYFSSDLNVVGDKNNFLVNLIKKVDGKFYLSGQGAKNFIDTSKFEISGLQVIWNNFEHPIYHQLNGGFIKGLSILDLLFNYGPDNVKDSLIKNYKKFYEI